MTRQKSSSINAKVYSLRVRLPLHHANALERLKMAKNTTYSDILRNMLDKHLHNV